MQIPVTESRLYLVTLNLVRPLSAPDLYLYDPDQFVTWLLQQLVHSKLSTLGAQILPPASVDITSPSSTSELRKAFKGASAVVSLAGLLVGNDKQMKALQEDGVRRVGEAASEEGVGRVVGVSAIGADLRGVTA